MRPARFSKAAVEAYLIDQMEKLEKAWGFHPGDGWKVAGADLERMRAFGSYAAYRRTLDDLLGGYIVLETEERS